MRTIRNLISTGIPLFGMVIVFGGVLVVHDLQTQILVVLVGVLMIEAGVWKLTNPLLPSERRYNALRDEVDRFIGLVRNLNAEALVARRSDSPSDWARVDSARKAMHESVDHMVTLAGREEGQIETSLDTVISRAAQSRPPGLPDEPGGGTPEGDADA
jgi:hypothetical protein